MPPTFISIWVQQVNGAPTALNSPRSFPLLTMLSITSWRTFPIVKRRDIARTGNENGNNGRYITKDTILEIYDEMAEAIRTGQPYQTRLDPPPGPPTDTEGNFIPMAEWDPNNWPLFGDNSPSSLAAIVFPFFGWWGWRPARLFKSLARTRERKPSLFSRKTTHLNPGLDQEFRAPRFSFFSSSPPPGDSWGCSTPGSRCDAPDGRSRRPWSWGP